MSISITTNGNIVCNDSDSNTIPFSKPVQITSVAGTVFANSNALTVGASPVSLTLPTSPVQFVFIKNTHATQTVSVTGTPNGGSSAVLVTLEPGSFFLVSEAQAGAGYTALSVTGSNTNTTLEFILAG